MRKVKIFPSVDKEMADKLKADAKKQMRSESSLLNYILTLHYCNEHKKEGNRIMSIKKAKQAKAGK